MLSVFAVGKLFLFDLSFLETGGKIVSYLSFGVVLLIISYMYQKFSKQLEGTGISLETKLDNYFDTGAGHYGNAANEGDANEEKRENKED
jgi:hypothetical protein